MLCGPAAQCSSGYRGGRIGRASNSWRLRPYDYRVQPVEVRGCLHLKSACSYIGKETVLVNRSWIDVEPLRGQGEIEHKRAKSRFHGPSNFRSWRQMKIGVGWPGTVPSIRVDP